jgi:hypothetical protein
MTAKSWYLPWVRQGLLPAVTGDPDQLQGSLPARTEAQLDVIVAESRPGSSTPRTVTVNVPVAGPGDLATINVGVVRQYPAPDAVEVDTTYFCMLELASCDFGWLLTPAAANGARLRPFMVLIAVDRKSSQLTGGGNGVPAVLRVDTGELPDLAQAHAWAFTHVVGETVTPDSVTGAATVRFLCPRKLASDTNYTVALVPAFEHGRRVGLGWEVPKEAQTAPAWDASHAGEVVLPAWFHWQITTGKGGDFEGLASRIESHRLSGPQAAGRTATFDEQAGLPEVHDVRWTGVVGPPPDTDGAPDEVVLPDGFTEKLRELVEDPRADLGGLPIAPPMYGRWHAGVKSLAAPPVPWPAELNLDLDHRHAAGVGTALFRRAQENVMEKLWRLVEGIERANAIRKLAQLARHAARTRHTQLEDLAKGEAGLATLLQLTAPAHSRVVDEGTGKTVAAAIAQSRVPAAMVSGEFRRALRPGGRLTRNPGTRARLLEAVNNDDNPVVPARKVPDGLRTPDDRRPDDGGTRWCEEGPDTLLNRPALDGWTPQQWSLIVKTLATAEERKPGCEEPVPQPRPRLDLDSLKDTLLRAADPDRTFPRHVNAQSGLDGWEPDDPLDPIMACPRLDTPVAELLVAHDPEFFCPGVSGLPNNSVTLGVASPKTLESLMVGVNTAVMDEMVFRGFPTDLRGTVFHRFWPRIAVPGDSADPTVNDIPPINEWAAHLGENIRPDGAPWIVLVRGELLQRFPRTAVYMARARWTDGRREPEPASDGVAPGAPEHPHSYPLFSGRIPPDITYLGFDIPDDAGGDPHQDAGKPGWFVVFEEPPFDTRYGLDESGPDHVTNPDDLSWAAVGQSASGYVDLTNKSPLDGWGIHASSAQLAAWCTQRPFSIAKHVSDLLATS